MQAIAWNIGVLDNDISPTCWIPLKTNMGNKYCTDIYNGVFSNFKNTLWSVRDLCFVKTLQRHYIITSLNSDDKNVYTLWKMYYLGGFLK